MPRTRGDVVKKTDHEVTTGCVSAKAR